MGETLRALGFTLVGGGALLDLDKAALDSAVQRFGAALQGADVGFFYYAGHGVQVRGGTIWIPVAANPVREADIDFQMLDTALVLRQMEAAGTRLEPRSPRRLPQQPVRRSRAALDRERPRPDRPRRRERSSPSRPSPAMSRSTGRAATAPTLRRCSRRCAGRASTSFKLSNAVGLAVKRSTAGAQQPWVSSSPIAGNIYFSGHRRGRSRRADRVRWRLRLFRAAEAERAWAVTKDSSSIAVMEDFVRQFGATPYGSMARARLEELRIEQRRRAAPEPGRLPRAPAQAGRRRRPRHPCPRPRP